VFSSVCPVRVFGAPVCLCCCMPCVCVTGCRVCVLLGAVCVLLGAVVIGFVVMVTAAMCYTWL